MGQLPIKLLKTDEVPKTCILLFEARISAVGKYKRNKGLNYT